MSQTSPQSTPDAAPPSSSRRTVMMIVLAAIVLGLLGRGFALSYTPRYSYPPDHQDFMAWSVEAFKNGPARIYTRENTRQSPWMINYRYYGDTGQTLDGPARVPHACNYPPLASYVFWAQGAIWRALGGKEETVYAPEPIARALNVAPGLPVAAPIANTYTARFVGALPSIVFDFVLAWGVAVLVRICWPDRRQPILEAVAFALVLLAPPVILDSSFWNQADSWIAALLAWCLVFMIRRRFMTAGMIFGVALLVKPQAIFLLPVIVFVLAAVRFVKGGTWTNMQGLLHMVATAAVTAFLLSLPHTINTSFSTADGWLERSYGDTVFGDMYPRVTLNAFNVWWFKQAATGSMRPVDPRETVFGSDSFGFTRDRIGKVLLILSILATWVLCARRWRWAAPSWVACTYMVALAAFMLPTRVHERYIYLCIPFLIVLAVRERKWLIPLVLLFVVGTFEMTSFRWVGKDTIGIATTLAVLSTIAFLCSFVFLFWRTADDEAIESKSSKRKKRDARA